MATSNRVLVVETERDLAVRLVATLEGHGFDHVDVVRSADGVLDAIVRSEPVVVLMEVSVSGEHDGLALAEEIIQQHGIPVVFLTGESDPQVVGRMHEVGAASVLVKPFSESEVPRVLRAAIARSRRVRQLAERNNRLWVTLQSIADAVVTVDVEGRVEHLNPAAERLSGWSVSAARGRRIEAVLDLRRTEGEPLVNPARIVLDTGRTRSRGSGIWLHPQAGTARRIGYTASPIEDDDGHVIGAVLIMQDLTEREQLQDLLARADRLASMGTMAAGIAHEINNPLTYIVNNVLFVLSELEHLGDVPEDVLVAVRDIEFGSRAIERIVGDLKLLSTPDQRSQEAVDLAPVLRRTQRMAAKTVRARGRFEASLRSTQPVLANPVAIGQVVTNLVLNAAQALPDDYSEDSVVRLSCHDDVDQVVIEVQDTGCGIPPELLERVFDPFFTTKGVGKGTGLGLAISHQIVTDLGGRIELVSEVGQGTTVRVILPVHSQAPDDVEDEPSLNDISYPQRRVLIVDDDDKVLRSMVNTLSRLHVDDAVDHLALGFGYDAILCDLMMSPRTGIELLDALTVVAPDLVERLAFITGGVFTGALQERVLRSGRPVAYKPFQTEQLLRLIEVLAQA